ncbi:MAG: FtsX-like permease family protein [Chitinophagales bacterium]|nr:FtsX-like permease family protein [Chitinophagales bacterium]
MNLPLTFARRYLISKKSSNAVNIISWVSVLGILVGAGGLILVLSVFNGFEGLVISLYNSFNPDFKITATVGKSFVPDSTKLVELRSLKGIRAVSKVIEENALLTHNDMQYIATVKGVELNYGSVSGIDSAIYDGVFLLNDGKQDFAVLGAGISQSLQINYADPLSFIALYIPKKGKTNAINPEDAFNRDLIKPSGSFAIQSEFDSKYIFVPLDFARALNGYDHQVSAIEIALNNNVDADLLQSQIQKIFGNSFKVKNRLQQNETLYKVMKTEKWAVYAILTLILIIAAFNIIGSLSMLVIEKKKDISILKTMGADDALIGKIFLYEGVLLAFIGCSVGFAIAITIIWLQHRFEFLKIGGGSFVIDAYPVDLKIGDLILVFFTVMIIGLIAAWLPSRRASKTQYEIVKE